MYTRCGARACWPQSLPVTSITDKGAVGQQWQSARPKGMSSKEFERVAKCWHKRTKNDPLLAAEELPPTSLLKLRMEEDWLRDFLFVHRGNIERLGKGFSDDEGGTLADNSEVLAYLPASGAEVRRP